MNGRLSLLTLLAWCATIHICALEGFSVEPVSETLAQRMREGGSYPKGCPIPLSDLRHVRVRHWNMEGREMVGELVCNALIANDLRDIFEELYRAHYPIHSVRLIDDFGANDDASMAANNTSAFCYRNVAGTTYLSYHATGLAIDINPKDNPVAKPRVKGGSIPKTPHVINEQDACYKAFHKRGFTWGGHWRSLKDYQHFERRGGHKSK